MPFALIINIPMNIKEHYLVCPIQADTRLLAQTAISEIRPATKKIIEIGTGTGYVVIKLAQLYPCLDITATDIDYSALDLTLKNIAANHLNNIKVIFSDLFSHIEPLEKYDLILFNPPLVPAYQNSPYRLAKFLVRKIKILHHLFGGFAYQNNQDFRLNLIKKFIMEAADMLDPQGKILMIATPEEISLLSQFCQIFNLLYQQKNNYHLYQLTLNNEKNPLY